MQQTLLLSRFSTKNIPLPLLWISTNLFPILNTQESLTVGRYCRRKCLRSDGLFPNVNLAWTLSTKRGCNWNGPSRNDNNRHTHTYTYTHLTRTDPEKVTWQPSKNFNININTLANNSFSLRVSEKRISRPFCSITFPRNDNNVTW